MEFDSTIGKALKKRSYSCIFRILYRYRIKSYSTKGTEKWCFRALHGKSSVWGRWNSQIPYFRHLFRGCTQIFRPIRKSRPQTHFNLDHITIRKVFPQFLSCRALWLSLRCFLPCPAFRHIMLFVRPSPATQLPCPPDQTAQFLAKRP